jgi:hypothetical protein
MSQNTVAVPYFQTGNPDTDEFTAAAGLPFPGMLGQLAEFDQGTPTARNLCKYQLVKQGAGIQGVAGTVLYWLDKAAKTVTTVNSGALAGVCQIAAGSAASYLWVCKKGRRSVLYVDAPASTPDTTGMPVVGSDTDGKADCLAVSETQGAFPLIGTSAGTLTSHVGLVDINIPDQY